MAKANARNELLASSDGRPRLYIRLVDNKGQVGIAYRTHPAARERVAATIEMAMHSALANVSHRAILIWDGLQSPTEEE